MKSTRKTGAASVADMLRSLLVVFAFVALLVLAFPRVHGNGIRTVDYASAVTQARRLAAFDVLAPEGLSSDWKATSVRVDGSGKKGTPTTFHLGFVTPKEEFAAIEESDQDATDFIRLETSGAGHHGTVVINGVQWEQRVRSARHVQALVRRIDGATVIVVGTAGWGELTTLAASLR